MTIKVDRLFLHAKEAPHIQKGNKCGFTRIMSPTA